MFTAKPNEIKAKALFVMGMNPGPGNRRTNHNHNIKNTMKNPKDMTQAAKTHPVKIQMPHIILTMALIAAFSGATTLSTGAADAKPTLNPPANITPAGIPEQKPGVPGKKEEQSARLVPFHGKLDSVDKTARSIKSGERTFQVMATTKITKDGVKPGTLDDAKVGESIGGAYHEGDGGSYQLVSLRLGPKPEKKTAAAKKK